MSSVAKPSAGKVGVFILVGFTLVLAILGTLVRIGFSMTERGAATIAEGTAPLYLLMQGLVASFPVCVTILFGLLIARRYSSIETIGRFLKTVFFSSVFFWLFIVAYFASTRGAELAKVVAAHGVLLPLLAVLTGIILWHSRPVFGITVI